jgi:3-oxoadipate enol-lactonase
MKLETNGIQTHYEFTGKTGAPVVMLSHSLACSSVMWKPQIELLESHFRVLRYDTRGHGDSEAPAGAYTLELLAQDAVGLLNALDIDRVHFVGLSMGGMIGQSLALDHADRLVTLALCDTAAVMPDETQPIWVERIAAAREKGMQGQVDETLERWFTPEYLKRNPPEVDMIRRQILATPVNGYIGCSEAIRRLNNLDRLSQITIPALIVVGEEDPGTPVAASQTMHERIGGSKLVVLASARHLSNIEASEEFNEAVLNFLLTH